MTKSIVIISGILLLSSGPAFAGWASGGGKIHRDSQNPWFLENTARVTYCIDQGADFDVPSPVLEQEVQSAISSWKRALRMTQDDFYNSGELLPYSQLRVGTQEFIQVPCSDNDVDLRFQFGTLTEQQTKKFENPKDFIGIAVRTDYDTVNLRGRGFIYLAPPTGPLAPDAESMDPKAWNYSDHFALKLVLSHELGHVFGIDHSDDTLMDDHWPELIVSPGFVAGVTPEILRHFRPKLDVIRFVNAHSDSVAEGCGGHSPIFTPYILGIPSSETDCGRVELTGHSLKIYSAPDSSSPMQLIAEAEGRFTHTASSRLVTVWLPKEQAVFTKLPEEVRTFRRLQGHEKIDARIWDGNLAIRSSNESLKMQLELTQRQGQVSVIKDGQLVNEVIFLD